MADSRFFDCVGELSLRDLADISSAEIAGDDTEGKRLFGDVAPLETATSNDVSFLDNKKYLDAFTLSKAGVCIVKPQMADRAPAGMALLLTPEPYHAYARVAQAFYPTKPFDSYRAPTCFVDDTASIGDDTCIEHGVYVGKNASIGSRCKIAPNAVIGVGVVIGDDTYVGPSVSLTHCLIGNRVFINAGVRIGQDGFGFALGAAGHLKVPQLGRVIVEDGVDIGANTTIDRGAGPDTVIGAGTVIDNLVQIGHNAQIGRGCVIVSQVGISGSTHVGQFVMMGGQVGIAGHLKIGDGVRIAAQSGVMRDIEPGTTVSGSPAIPAREFWRQVASVSALTKKKNKE